ncbi:hypothetical protein [Gimesia sp.]|uniref:hypothetical protein n=1 Tax=Gimesia sp. TaxID=2024833 RepID=UPI003A90EE55
MVHVRNAQTGKSVKTWNAPEPIQGLGYSPNGKELNLLLQGKASIWSTQDEKQLRQRKLNDRIFIHPDSPPQEQAM